MGSSERLHLRWNDFESNIKLGFSELRKDEEFFDVTIACGPKQIKAHKVILSACSPFFRSLIKSISHPHPLLYLRGIKFSHLESLLCFMYNGEVNVTQEELSSLLSVAEELQIKGLTQDQPSSSHSSADGGPPSKKSRSMKSSINSKTNASSSSSNSGAGIPGPSSIGSSAQQSGPQPITIDDSEEIQDVTPMKVEQKFVPTENDPAAAVNESSEFDNDLHEEKYIDEAEFLPDSGDIDYSNDGSTMDAAYAEPHGSSVPSGSANENEGNVEDMNAAFDLEIEKCIRKFGPKQFGCVKCNYRATQRNLMKSHVECNHFITRGFPCEVCGYLCKTRPSLKMHIFRRHKKAPQFFPVGGDK